MNWKGHSRMIVTGLLEGIWKETIITLYEQLPGEEE
jgi:hypothetical protein